MLPDLHSKRLPLFPISTQDHSPLGKNRLSIAGCDLDELAGEYGTPLYLYDRATLDGAAALYRNALAQYYPAESGVTYAGKAYLSLAIAQWTQTQDLWVDCTGLGEMTIAEAASVPRAHILVHGVNKSPQDLHAAIQLAGVVVVDNLSELQRLSTLARSHSGKFPDLWLRIRPGTPVDTHVYTQTGQSDSKFGMDFSEALQAVQACLEEGLPLKGLHFHQGSHFHDPTPVATGIGAVLDLVVETSKKLGWRPQTICPGGGWGVAYHEDDLPQPSIEGYVRFLSEQLRSGCTQRNLPLPRLQLEPGRSLVARAGVALYRVGAIKHTPNRRWIMLDGGMSDNPRPGLYGARYSALPVFDPQRPATGPAWLAGPFCESSDVLIEALPMPDVQPGELIAVPASGAYHLSMGSNYNGARKPAVLWLENGRAVVIQVRETPQDLYRRDRRLQFSPVQKKG